jgi:hypothetical protein
MILLSQDRVDEIQIGRLGPCRVIEHRIEPVGDTPKAQARELFDDAGVSDHAHCSPVHDGGVVGEGTSQHGQPRGGHVDRGEGRPPQAGKMRRIDHPRESSRDCVWVATTVVPWTMRTICASTTTST